MGVFIVIAVAVMLGMLYLGLYLSLEWEPEARITGICTALWAGVAIYLFLFQWLTLKEPSWHALLAITLPGTAGYIVGRTVTIATRREWIWDDLRHM